MLEAPAQHPNLTRRKSTVVQHGLLYAVDVEIERIALAFGAQVQAGTRPVGAGSRFAEMQLPGRIVLRQAHAPLAIRLHQELVPARFAVATDQPHTTAGNHRCVQGNIHIRPQVRVVDGEHALVDLRSHEAIQTRIGECLVPFRSQRAGLEGIGKGAPLRQAGVVILEIGLVKDLFPGGDERGTQRGRGSERWAWGERRGRCWGNFHSWSG